MLQSGVRLGPYEILGQLGAGGMGEVYRAVTAVWIAMWRSRATRSITSTATRACSRIFSLWTAWN